MLAQSSDTHIEIEKIQISMIRQESIAKKASRMCSLSQTTLQLSRRAIKRANPTLNEGELDILFVGYLYGSDLAERFCHHFNNKPQQAMKKADIIEAAHPVATAFDELGICYYIGGSVASSVYGFPRATQGVDLVTDLKAQHVSPLVEKLSSTYYIDKDMIFEAICGGKSFNLIHLDTMIKIDVFLTKDAPYHRSVFQRRREDTLDVEDDNAPLKFFIASSEDIILNKLDWFRMRGYISEQQWRDIQGVLKVQKESLDREYLFSWAKELELTDLLEKACQEAGLSYTISV
jgi:hypothetical protein